MSPLYLARAKSQAAQTGRATAPSRPARAPNQTSAARPSSATLAVLPAGANAAPQGDVTQIDALLGQSEAAWEAREYQSAIETAQRALVLCQTSLGLQHPRTLDAQNRLQQAIQFVNQMKQQSATPSSGADK